MLIGLEMIGLEMLAEHLAADALVGARAGRGLGGDYGELLSSWVTGLSAPRTLRFGLFCVAVGAESTAEKARTWIATRH
jgi:hypothetical protein